ncbi:hypothetical protein TraAM80_00901 [Trypanosoma rangeli]|uniref:MRH domain-containing protein n=1 Tax=Trypanosoma rangeli TaxID=5698 RepID=A0A422P199_TRYRA|nr:uncharacterized protein TraAM80_00901 [Trypanosoma rangeli]RNF11455.1 hypothetical protein TraAM80_00901 [Trypanosoma rangeli]|eukprot:RNF11455.1 hypothetical protein TraAM80_00901 [Trypanosoma rangeli]
MPLEGFLRVAFAASVLFACVSAEECALARQLRESELKLFVDLSSPESTKQTPSECIRWHIGYWRYELCPGRWVRQYREVKEVIIEEHILGVQHQWHLNDKVGSRILQYIDGPQTVPGRLRDAGLTLNAENSLYSCAKERKGGREIQVDVLYPNGSPCETGSRRTSLLHFVCNENAHNPLVTLKEPSICEYDLTVAAATICKVIYGTSNIAFDLDDAGMKFVI